MLKKVPEFFVAIFVGAVTLTVGMCAQSLARQSGGGKSADDKPCGIVYGESHAFTICAPKGWELDNSILNDQGIYAAFYPTGTTWNRAKESRTVMYINTSGKGTGDDELAESMKGDVERTKKQAPMVKITEVARIKTPDGDARVQQFEHSMYDRFEAVAYLDSPKIIVLFVMTSKDGKSFERDFPAFQELVKSYKFLSSHVEVNSH
ncbi:MAG: hypothetical protein P4N24_09585 [Acidobacteriota bacterium]|nr:hypothetical protein [Acidobacteriota bacterium]